MTNHPLFETTPQQRRSQATWQRFFQSLGLPEPYQLSEPFTPDLGAYYLTLAKMPAWQRMAELVAARDQALVEDNWRLAHDLNVSITGLEALVPVEERRHA